MDTKAQLIRDMHQNLRDGLINFSDMAQLMRHVNLSRNLATIRVQMQYFIDMNKLGVNRYV